MGEIRKTRRVFRTAVSRRGPRDAWARLLLVLLLALVPALNLAAPVASRMPAATANAANDRITENVAPAGFADARFDFCLPASQPVHDDTDGDGAGHTDGHHADPLCLQCIALGTPGLPGAPDIVPVAAIPVFGIAYSCTPSSLSTTRAAAVPFCRGPPYAV